MKKNNKALYVADFETTTDINDCRVWAWGLYNIYEDSFIYGNDIKQFMALLGHLENKATIFIHNLKFDGEFLFYELFKSHFKHSLEEYLSNGEFRTLITNTNIFYATTIKTNDVEVVILDSLKIINLPVKEISKAFGIEQLKGEIDYDEFREVGHILTADEVAYLKNDCEIVGKALLYFFNQGLTKMTMASNAFHDFKKTLPKGQYEKLFPKLVEIHDSLKEAYKGGFTYCNPKFQGKTITKGLVLDVNSLYPHVLYTCKLPYGEPIAFNRKYKHDKLYDLHIQIICCHFKLKEGYLPTIQIKGNRFFGATEYATSNNGHDVVLYLTNIDLALFFEHYHVYNIEYLGGWKFKSTDRIFKPYIEKWTRVKEDATISGNEGLRSVAKYMQNTLYGRFGLSVHIRNKTPTFDGELVHYELGEEEEREPVYIPTAIFVTSYARDITIRSAMLNIDTFLYADTDSLHICTQEIPTNIEVDNVKRGCWKLEYFFERGKFIRSKSYIEEVLLSEEKYNNLSEEKKKKWAHNEKHKCYSQLHIACAGLPKKCHSGITFDSFRNGMIVYGKLQMKRVKGGIVLKPTTFEMNM